MTLHQLPSSGLGAATMVVLCCPSAAWLSAAVVLLEPNPNFGATLLLFEPKLGRLGINFVKLDLFDPPGCGVGTLFRFFLKAVLRFGRMCRTLDISSAFSHSRAAESKIGCFYNRKPSCRNFS